ncbi:aspartate kinase [Anditalea andensis]|uniref:Aspartokinase n=1 Tax=Anditalea andensis TaxID=1048983 RepID=A0A074KXN5_9BACT|nr:aspartate kinase [Anditalea andensis]KEO73699.1 aspartate kinase [Anditalea andensis]
MSKTFVFKFGGAAVKDAMGFKNLYNILNNRLRNPPIIVISAIGKTTNLLENILNLKYEQKDYSSNITIVKNLHMEICHDLFEDGHLIFAHVDNHFAHLKRIMARGFKGSDKDAFYDEVVSFGELIATRMVQEYLCDQKLYCLWQDVRELIFTDQNHRDAKVNWEKTYQNCQKILLPKLKKYPVVTQGFIAWSDSGYPTTLGREGSDYTAAILAACTAATSVTIWKDVPGVLNADPKKNDFTVLFHEIDYHQAAEMAFYGANVIHPKTIKPLANKSIPLWVKSFLEPDQSGTLITNSSLKPEIPTIITKENQVLVTLWVRDLTFISGEHLQYVYGLLNKLKLKINLIQTSAVSISICIDKEFFNIELWKREIKGEFQFKYNVGLQLLTILHYTRELIELHEQGREILLEQRTRTSYQIAYLEKMVDTAMS